MQFVFTLDSVCWLYMYVAGLFAVSISALSPYVDDILFLLEPDVKVQLLVDVFL